MEQEIACLTARGHTDTVLIDEKGVFEIPRHIVSLGEPLRFSGQATFVRIDIDPAEVFDILHLK